MSRPKDIEITSVTVSSDSINHDIKTPAAVSEDNDDNEVKTSSRWRRVIGYIWDSAEGTPRNRRYVQKLDAYML